MPEIIRAIRTQVDGLNEEYSKETALDCSIYPDMARQEFKDESDPNKVLARYGVGGIPDRQPQYSAIDYDMDLQQSLESIREAERAIAKLPPELQIKYGTWAQLLDGALNGKFRTDLAAYQAEKAAEAAAATAKAALEKQGAPSGNP